MGLAFSSMMVAIRSGRWRLTDVEEDSPIGKAIEAAHRDAEARLVRIGGVDVSELELEDVVSKLESVRRPMLGVRFVARLGRGAAVWRIVGSGFPGGKEVTFRDMVMTKRAILSLLVKDGGRAFTEGVNAGDVLVGINGDSATNFEDAADATEFPTDLKGKENVSMQLRHPYAMLEFIEAARGEDEYDSFAAGLESAAIKFKAYRGGAIVAKVAKTAPQMSLECHAETCSLA